MLKKGIYVLFLVLAQIAFAQEKDLCIDQPPEESLSDGHDSHPCYTVYYSHTLQRALKRYWKHLYDLYNRYNNGRLKLMKIDCAIQESICIRQNITHFPTFKFFRDERSKGITFHGKLDIATMTAFIDEQLENIKTAG